MFSKRHLYWLSLFCIAILVYGLTAAPGLSWEHRGADGGDLISAAATWGVPHPPGYPTYTLLLALFVRLFPNQPAAGGNLFSAISGALAAAFCGLLIWEILDRLAQGWEQKRWIGLAAAAGALTFAFTPLVWCQALITEVYTFHLLLVSVFFYLLLRWRKTGRGLGLCAFVFGLGLTHHLTIVFVLPAALMILIDGRKHLERALFPKGYPGADQWNGSSDEKRTKIRWRALFIVVGTFLAGLVPFAYLPLAARKIPPVNWENPQNWNNLLKLVLAARYRQNFLGASPSDVYERLAEWTRLVPPVFLAPLIVILFIVFIWILLRNPAIGSMVGIFVVLCGGYALGYRTSDYWVNLLPAFLFIAGGIAVGIWRLLCWLGKKRWRFSGWAAVLVTVIMPVGLLVTQWNQMDISRDHDATEYIDAVTETIEPDALVFAKGDQSIFTLWYARYTLNGRKDWVPILPTFLRSYWYRLILAENHQGLDLRSTGLGAEALETMIERHIDTRPIYLTWEDETTMEHYSLIEAGPLWQVEENRLEKIDHTY